MGLLSPGRVFAAGVAAALLTSGCAARQSGSIAGRFLKSGKPKTEYPAEILAAGADAKARALEFAKARDLALRQGPPTRPPLPSLESTDPELLDVLHRLAVPSVDSHLAVADVYRRRGVLDKAFEHYDAALRLDRRSSAAYDGMARIWRDIHRLDFAIGDATRAVYLGPKSPEALNTLGTILLALGNPEDARSAFAKALALDPGASYARHNGVLADRQARAQAGSSQELK